MDFYYWGACKGVSTSEIAWQHGRDVNIVDQQAGEEN
jgi:hypothetical protein